jgi:peroxiredoxin Q/BCP
LLSDPNKELIKKAAWGTKKMFGKEYQGLIRTTYLLDKDNKVIKVWPKVKVKGHAEEVLKLIKDLNKK